LINFLWSVKRTKTAEFTYLLVVAVVCKLKRKWWQKLCSQNWQSARCSTNTIGLQVQILSNCDVLCEKTPYHCCLL